MHENVYENLHRALKVDALIETIDANARLADLDPHLAADKLEAMLRRCDDAGWLKIAVEANVNPPSRQTCDLVIETYARRAQSLRRGRLQVVR